MCWSGFAPTPCLLGVKVWIQNILLEEVDPPPPPPHNTFIQDCVLNRFDIHSASEDIQLFDVGYSLLSYRLLQAYIA